MLDEGEEEEEEEIPHGGSYSLLFLVFLFQIWFAKIFVNNNVGREATGRWDPEKMERFQPDKWRLENWARRGRE